MRKPPRSQAGSTTTREVKVRICKSCGCAVDETGLCHSDCDNDACHHKGELTRPGTYFHAVYKRTDKFLRDEKVV